MVLLNSKIKKLMLPLTFSLSFLHFNSFASQDKNSCEVALGASYAKSYFEQPDILPKNSFVNLDMLKWYFSGYNYQNYSSSSEPEILSWTMWFFEDSTSYYFPKKVVYDLKNSETGTLEPIIYEDEVYPAHFSFDINGGMMWRDSTGTLAGNIVCKYKNSEHTKIELYKFKLDLNEPRSNENPKWILIHSEGE